MEFYCLPDFKQQYQALLKKKDYKDIERLLLKHLSQGSIDELTAGTKLNSKSTKHLYLKKRLKGSGGFRLYYTLTIVDNKVYFQFIHPKTGKRGYGNILDDYKKELYQKFLSGLKDKTFFKVEMENSKITFSEKNIY